MRNKPHSGKRTTDTEELFLTAERHEAKREYRKAFRCLLEAAESGHNSSQLNLGNYYASGTGVEKDSARAAYWYGVAFRRGNEVGARNLAIDRLKAGNIRSAITWFKKAVAKKDGGSFVALAQIYLAQRGGVAKATKLLQRVLNLTTDHASDLDKEQASMLLMTIRDRRANKLSDLRPSEQ